MGAGIRIHCGVVRPIKACQERRGWAAVGSRSSGERCQAEVSVRAYLRGMPTFQLGPPDLPAPPVPFQRSDLIAIAAAMVGLAAVPAASVLAVWANGQPSAWAAYGEIAAFVASYVLPPVAAIACYATYRLHRIEATKLREYCARTAAWAEGTVTEAHALIQDSQSELQERRNYMAQLDANVVSGGLIVASLMFAGTCMTRTGKGCQVTLRIRNLSPVKFQIRECHAAVAVDGQPSGPDSIPFVLRSPLAPGADFGSAGVELVAVFDRPAIPPRREGVSLMVSAIRLGVTRGGQAGMEQLVAFDVQGCVPVAPGEP